MAARQSDAAAHAQTHRARTLAILKTLRFVDAPPEQATANDAAAAGAAAPTVVGAGGAAHAAIVTEDTATVRGLGRAAVSNVTTTNAAKAGKRKVTFATIPHPSLHDSDPESDEE